MPESIVEINEYKPGEKHTPWNRKHSNTQSEDGARERFPRNIRVTFDGQFNIIVTLNGRHTFELCTNYKSISANQLREVDIFL
jgi:hypothetical protein